MKNNNGPSIEPSGTPALTAAHLEPCPFKTTLWHLFAKKSSIIFIKFLDTPLSLSFNNKPFCQTLSKGFDMPRKPLLTSKTRPNDI